MKPNWCRTKDDQPDRSGHYLCWDERDQNMWIGVYDDVDGQDTWGDERKMGWLNGDVPTHWADRPLPPIA